MEGPTPAPSPLAPDGSPMPGFQHQSDSYWNVTFPRPQHPKSQEKVLHPQILTTSPTAPCPHACVLCPQNVPRALSVLCSPCLPCTTHRTRWRRSRALHPVPVGTETQRRKETAPQSECQLVAGPRPASGLKTPCLGERDPTRASPQVGPVLSTCQQLLSCLCLPGTPMTGHSVPNDPPSPF